ncbi:MAG TPA: alpha-hydroxy-acid oxidizing protein, partial [Thermomicrobiaceae bacterium]|nr:alpha-hydroxy-acid oxidizing protein [Thermomicrobiaceae bacterium]
ADWGLPTADAVRLARRAAPDARIFASGGIRDGMDVAKAIALGADMVGVAGTFLRAAAQGEEVASELAGELIATLRTVMFCLGEPTPAALRATSRLVPRDGAVPAVFSAELVLGRDGDSPFRDVTEQVAAVVARSGIQSGVAHCFVDDADAAILLGDAGGLAPVHLTAGADGHRAGTSGSRFPATGVDGHAAPVTLTTAALNPAGAQATSFTAPVVAGQLRLAAGRSIVVVERASPRERRISVQVLGL